MSGESRGMGGRNLVAWLIVLVLVGCGESTPPGVRIADLEVHSRAVHRDMDVKVSSRPAAAGGPCSCSCTAAAATRARTCTSRS
jgi:hypothetical protein